MPQRFETGFRKSPKNKDELVAQPLITDQGIPIKIRGQIDRIDTYTKVIIVMSISLIINLQKVVQHSI